MGNQHANSIRRELKLIEIETLSNMLQEKRNLCLQSSVY